MSSSLAASFVVVIALVSTACRQPGFANDCLSERGVEVWVERRFPATVQLADTAFASLSIAIARDSTTRVPAGSMVSVVIAGPAEAQRPDTVRVLALELPVGRSLWRGDQLRPGRYMAQLTTTGYVAGPRTFSLAPGERVQVEAQLHRTTTCDPDSVRPPR